MAITYPTSLDTLTNPTSGQTLAAGNHTQQHADANDAIEALEAKCGITGSADTASLTYQVAACAIKANNLSDLASASTARTNLGFRSGHATIDFGAFPGASDASVTVSGQTGIATGSTLFVWLRAEATSDHSADEHAIETIRVVGGSIVAGTGFTISAVNTGTLSEPLYLAPKQRTSNTVIESTAPPKQSVGGKGTRLYGQWSVSWMWF